MAGDDNKQQGNQGGNQGGGGGGGGGGQQKARSPRKSLLDSTNLVGAGVWLTSALLTAIAFSRIFISLPANCYGARGEIIADCVQTVVRSSDAFWVAIASLAIQALITTIVRRTTNIVLKRVANGFEWFLNFVGIFWLFCVQLGVAPGLRLIIVTFVQNLTLDNVAWFALFIGLAIGWDYISNALFDAQPKQGGGQRR